MAEGSEKRVMTEGLSDLIVGLIAPIGTDLDPICDAIASSLEQLNYSLDIVRLSTLLCDIETTDRNWPVLVESPEYDRYVKYMNAGNEFRTFMDRGDALAMLAVGAILDLRSESRPKAKRAFILRSLKHHEEVASLRRIYGPSFVALSVYSPPSMRVQHLANRICESMQQFQPRSFLGGAHNLINKNEQESDDPMGQNVRTAFPMADFFVNGRSRVELHRAIKRIVELLFGNVFITPNKDEYAMFLAQAAAARSASLQRQVGAVITTTEGDVIAVGANEVPKPGGGLYWEGDLPDHRDFTLGHEINDKLKHRMLLDVLKRLLDSGMSHSDYETKDPGELAERLIKQGVMKDAQIQNVIEFGRCVHAEMAALMDAARRGVSVNGATLYSTTFPCHECARHIVAAGIKRVLYVEPYAKSLVNQLYPDSVQIEGENRSESHVCFEPFVGVTPRRYLDLFRLGNLKRKGKMGDVTKWDPAVASPRLGEYPIRTQLINQAMETAAFDQFASEFTAKGFQSKSPTAEPPKEMGDERN